jgi:hypothetical protein
MEIQRIDATLLKILGSEFAPGRGEPLPLAVGERLSALVTAQLGDGRVLLEVRGQSLAARSGVPLTPGQALELEVAGLGHEIALRVMGGGPAVSERNFALGALNAAHQAAPQTPPADVGALLALVEQDVAHLPEAQRHDVARLLAPLRAASGPEALAVELKHLLENGGLLFERRVRDWLQQSQASAPARMLPPSVASDMKVLLGLIGRAVELTAPPRAADSQPAASLTSPAAALASGIAARLRQAVAAAALPPALDAHITPPPAAAAVPTTPGAASAAPGGAGAPSGASATASQPTSSAAPPPVTVPSRAGPPTVLAQDPSETAPDATVEPDTRTPLHGERTAAAARVARHADGADALTQRALRLVLRELEVGAPQDRSAIDTLRAEHAHLKDELLARQIDAAYHWVRDGTLDTHWPLAFGDQTVQAFFRFHRGLEDRDAADGRTPAEAFSFDVALDPPGLGPVRAHVAWAARQLRVQFFVARQPTADTIDAELASLAAALQTGGFASVNASVSVDEARSHLEPLPPLQGPAGGSILNLRA